MPPRTPKREDRSISAAAAAADLGRASPSPNANPNRNPVRPKPTVPDPVATATTPGRPLRPAVGSRSRPPPRPSPAPPPVRPQPTVPVPVASATTPGPLRPAGPSPSPAPPLPSSRTGPSSSSSSSSGTSPVFKKSYASAVKGEGPANQNHLDDYSHRLYMYFDKFAIKMEWIGNSEIKILQAHLQQYDIELAHVVFNSQYRFKELLYPTVCRFLSNNGIVNNGVEGMDASFYTVRPSTKSLDDFVREQGPLVSMQSIVDGNFKLCVASGIGMLLAHGFLLYIFDIHKYGRTWNGDFSTCHMEVVVENCFQFRITKMSKTGPPHWRAADLHRIAEIFKPMFTIDEKMALYFDVLLEELSKVNNREVEKKWHRKYILSHPALKPPTARYNLECGLHHAVDTAKTNGFPMPSVFQDGSDWMAIIPPQISEDKPDSCLHTVFWFGHKSNEDFSPFKPTVEALLRFIRHFLQHGQKHIKVQDHIELEKYVAKTFPQALPNILRGLLSRNEMNAPFKDHWEEYCSSRVGNDYSTEGRIGIRISF